VSVEIRTGGLFRCCIATLEDAWNAGELPNSDGSLIVCKYCRNATMRFRDGAWEWDKSPKDAA